jgi:tetratricopeptide (TPR) repeat protein
MWSGRLADAEAACRSLLDRAHDPSVEAPARLPLARTLAAQGRVRDSLEELERVRRSRELSDELRAGAWGAESMARLELGDLDGAVAAAGQARATADRAGDHAAASHAMASLAMAEALRANLDRGLELVEEAARLAGQHPKRRGYQYSLHVVRGSILVELDRLEDARHALEAGIRTSEDLGVRWPSPSTRRSSGWSATWPANGTTPWPSSRPPWSWRGRPASATASSSATACGR